MTEISYKGWTIWKWTGWKPNIDSDARPFSNIPIDNKEFGQWLAHRKSPTGEEEYLYVAVPGSEGRFLLGKKFNITLQLGQVQVTSDTPLEEKERFKQEGYERMLRLIDNQESYDQALVH